MKGLVLEDRNKLVWKNDLPEPRIGPHDAVIKPVIVAPCTSDVHIIETMFIPFVRGKAVGHELAGYITEVGSEVRDFKVGDRVAVSASMPNWRTLGVQDGFIKNHDLSIYMNPAPGRHGAFAEKFHVVDADLNVAHIPDGVSWEQAVILSDMATTAFEGVDQTHIKFGDTVAVLGIGAVGLMAVCGAVLKGAGRIFGVGSRPVCFEVGQAYGVTDPINYKEGDTADQILSKTGGKPVDAVIICGGRTDIFTTALRIVKSGGTVTNLASFMDEESIQVPLPFFFIDKCIKNILVHGGRVYMERLLSMVEAGRFQPEKIITHTYHGMEMIETALGQMSGRDRTAIKPVVFFE